MLTDISQVMKNVFIYTTWFDKTVVCLVNSVCWAPHDFGLILACGSSDGSISVITYNGNVLCLFVFFFCRLKLNVLFLIMF